VIIVKEPLTFGILVALWMMKCIILISFAFKASHDVAFNNFVGQTHVQNQNHY
jgi:hypothetical protein